MLAGFVEVGESLEQAIHREIGRGGRHPAGRGALLRQPALAVPAVADARVTSPAPTSTEICVDADEIGYAAWFTRDELTEKLASGEIWLPGKSSIAHRLVQAWRDGDLA